MKYLFYLERVYHKEIELSLSSIFALSQFLEHETLSAYNVEQLLRGTDYKADYRNIFNKIKRFESLNMLEKVKDDKYTAHGAIYYKLTSFGLFYLLCNTESDRNSDFKNLVSIINNTPSLKEIMIPFINMDLLILLSDSTILSIFIEYLSEICKVLQKKFRILCDINKSGFFHQPFINWNSISKYATDNYYKNDISRVILAYWYPQLKKNPTDQDYFTSFNIDNIKNNDLKIHDIEYANEENIRFYIDENEYSFRIDKSVDRAKLYKNNKEVATNKIKKSIDDYVLFKVKFPNRDIFIKEIGCEFSNEIGKLTLKFGLSLLSQYEDLSGTDKSNVGLQKYRKDLNTIAKDKSINKLITSLDKSIPIWFNGFLKSGK